MKITGRLILWNRAGNIKEVPGITHFVTGLGTTAVSLAQPEGLKKILLSGLYPWNLITHFMDWKVGNI
jgi:hypothetical protein